MTWMPIPSPKAPGVDEFISTALGIDRKESIKNKTCPLCESKIELDSFKDEVSLREFHISGMCQKCQDKLF